MANWRKTIEKLRQWIDDEDSRTEHALENTQVKKSSISEEFTKRIVWKINAVLEDEVIRLPVGRTYVPSQFTVFLNEFDDKTLRHDKREFLEKAIGDLMLEKAKDLAGSSQLTARNIVINLEVDGNLQNNEIRVEAVSDHLRETLRSSGQRNLAKLESTIADLDATIDDESAEFKPLYYLEVWRDGKKLEEFPIIKREITFGRKCPESGANIRLESDNRKISRIHASLRLDENGEILVTALHTNPIVVKGKPVSKKGAVKLEKGEKFEIYEFTLRLRFADE